MSYAHSVSVGPRFFRKAFNDYSDKYWAFAREVMQNSIDCGSTHISVTIGELDDVKTLVVVENNGDVMTQDVLINRLLSLGESGKDFNGSVGGFGKAKEILYFAHQSYMIETGPLQVEGCGAGYNLLHREEAVAGTRSSVVWEGERADALRSAFRRFIELAGTGKRVTYEIDGEIVVPGIKPGRLERTLDHEGAPWAEVRISKTEANVLVVRIGGIPMFYSTCDFKAAVVVDLLGSSADRLTSNRDGLKWPYSSQLSEFTTTVAVDRQTAFKLEKPIYTRYAGEKLQRPQAGTGIATLDDMILSWVTAARADTSPPKGGAGIMVQIQAQVEAPKVNLLGHEFIVKNCVRKSVPKEFDPDGLVFSGHARWLVKAWAGCLLELYDLHQIDNPFSVGFVLSEDCIAQAETGSDYGTVYYLNPCVVSKRRNTRRYNKGKRFEIVASAAHEFVHGALNESYHGEDFANKLTEVMAKVMKNSRRFARHLG
jgi:hypothetical protein